MTLERAPSGSSSEASLFERMVGTYTGGADLVVAVAAESFVDVLRFRGGGLWSVDRDDVHALDQADILVTPWTPAKDAMLLLGAESTHDIRVRSSSESWQKVYPYDLDPDEKIKGPVAVDLIVQHVLYRSPFGTMFVFDSFVGGVLNGRTPGVAHRPDVIVKNDWRNSVLSNDPSVSILDAIAGVDVSGRSEAIMLTALALYESRSLRSSLGRHRRTSESLFPLARHTATAEWRRACLAVTGRF